MAIKASLRRAIERIGLAFDDYAARRGWTGDDYDVYVRYNEEWGRIGIIFVAKGFEGEGRYARFKQVMDHLEEALSDDPELFHAINLVIWSRSEVESGGFLTSVSDESVPIREFLVGGPAN